MPLLDFLRDNWPLMLVPLLGMVAIYALLPRPKRGPILLGAATGIVALILTGLLIVRVGKLNVETFLFYVFSLAAILAGGLLVTQKNPARAALSFTLVILATCGLFLLQAAPFLMVATIIVYAGAIIVTFLFVIMLAQQEGPSDADARSREPFLASMTGFLLLAALLYVLKLTYKPDLDRWVEKTMANLDRVKALADRSDVTAEDAKPVIDDLRQFVQDYKRWLKNEWSRPRDAEAEKNRRIKSPPPGGEELEAARYDVEAELPDDEHLARMNGDRLRERLALIDTRLTRLHEAGITTRNDPQLGALRPTTKKLSELSGPAASRRAHLPPPSMDMTPKQYEEEKQNLLRRDEEGRPHLPAENTAYLGRSLFTDYLLLVELAGMLLLVAAVGAIAITHHRGGPRTTAAERNSVGPASRAGPEVPLGSRHLPPGTPPGRTA